MFLRIFIFWILILGFDLLSGYCGLCSFGFIDISKEKKDLAQKIVQLEYFSPWTSVRRILIP